MWGQELIFLMCRLTQGIIPTRVGTRCLKLCHKRCPPDHPHACGDKKCYSPVNIQSWGSSPRVWGQVDKDFSVDLSERIIPTRVGTSIGGLPIGLVGRDHPHACGDKALQDFPIKVTRGSSPRVWGQAQD